MSVHNQLAIDCVGVVGAVCVCAGLEGEDGRLEIECQGEAAGQRDECSNVQSSRTQLTLGKGTKRDRTGTK